MLAAIIHPENQVMTAFFELGLAEAVVPQYKTFSSANQDFLMQLMMFCDLVLHNYLSKIADTPEKRNHLHALYTTADTLGLVGSLEAFHNDIIRILELYPPTFQPCRNPHVLFDAI